MFLDPQGLIARIFGVDPSDIALLAPYNLPSMPYQGNSADGAKAIKKLRESIKNIIREETRGRPDVLRSISIVYNFSAISGGWIAYGPCPGETSSPELIAQHHESVAGCLAFIEALSSPNGASLHQLRIMTASKLYKLAKDALIKMPTSRKKQINQKLVVERTIQLGDVIKFISQLLPEIVFSDIENAKIHRPPKDNLYNLFK